MHDDDGESRHDIRFDPLNFRITNIISNPIFNKQPQTETQSEITVKINSILATNASASW